MHELEANDISAERKSLYDDFKCMDEHLGIEVIKEQKGRETYYHVESRPFELAEVKLLIQAISRKNEESWQFAQECFGRLWFKLGLVLLPVSLIAYIPFMNSSQDTLGDASLVIMIVQMVVLLSPYIPTEMQLKKRFSD